MIIFKLAEILDKKELSQRFIVEKTGIRPGTVNAYYHNYIKRVNVEDLNKICKALKCNPKDLIEYIPDKE